MKYSREELVVVGERLLSLPPVENAKTLNKQEAIGVLTEQIATLRSRGYTIEQIAQALCDSGVQISTPTLKSYLHRSKGTQKSGGRKRAGKQAGKRAGSTRVAAQKRAGSTGGEEDETAGSPAGGSADNSSDSVGGSSVDSGRVSESATFTPMPDSEDI